MGASGAAIRPATFDKLHGGGKGPYDPGMETRVAKLEGAHGGVQQSQSVLVMSVMGLAALFFALAGIMVTLQIFTFTHLGGRIDNIETRVDRVETRLGQVETRIGQVETRIGQVETRIGQVESRLERVEAKVDALPGLISREFQVLRAEMATRQAPPPATPNPAPSKP